ncbi:MAG TPA: tetratricopeptide repeat protein [Polyangia bacterium]|nr:tetratricopeptide repeat protein [Polyangia bacterium]
MAKQNKTEEQNKDSASADEARARLAATGRNDACPCGSGKKYKKCHLVGDEQATAAPPEKPDAQELVASAWRLFEQRRPGAAEKEFKAALALDDKLTDARVGIGMARLAAGNADGAKEELGAVLASEQANAEKLKGEGVKDAFNRPDAQPYIRAAHALGCLAYDEDRFQDAATELARVYAIDEGSVGVEARMIAAKSLMKLEKPADAIAILEPAAKLDTGKGRVDVGLALAYFASGKESEARAAIERALDSNAHYGKTLLGKVRRRVENIAAAQPGSLEEALLYTQTYGDVWTDDAKKFLQTVLDARARTKGAGAPAKEEAATAG